MPGCSARQARSSGTVCRPSAAQAKASRSGRGSAGATAFTESLDAYGDFFPGMGSVPVADVARAYVRSVEGAQTGQVYAVK